MVPDKQTRLLFLGVGNAFSEGMDYSSILMNDRILVDPSPTSVPRMKEAGVDISAIDTVLITHMHGDHILGFPFLILEYTYRIRRRTPLVVVCPEGGASTLMGIVDMVYADIPHREKVSVEFVELSDGDVGRPVKAGELLLVPYRTYHGPALSFGYAVHTNGPGSPSVGFSGDTGPCKGLQELSGAVRALVVEMAQEDSGLAVHMGVRDIMELRRGMDVMSPIIVTHHYGPSPETRELLESMVEGPVHIASDMQRFSLDLL